MVRAQRVPILIFVLCLLVFALQPYKVGFEKGHHGWVSAHVLAQIVNAVPENLFLGFTNKLKTASGALDYYYFDRYPVLFSGLSHLVLEGFRDNLAHYIYAGRQWMNVVFVVLGLLVLRLNLRLTDRKEKAWAATLFVLSSSYLMRYKDMVHFDQPALVGCLLVLNGIVDFELTKSKKYLLVGSLLGPLLGRGYSVIFFLLFWVLYRGWKDVAKAKKGIRSVRVPVLFFLLSFPLPAAMLAWNIAGEAKIRNVPWQETSIVISARRRLGMDDYVHKDNTVKHFSWPSYVNNQLQRTLDYLTPYPLFAVHVKNYKRPVTHYLSLLPKAIYQILLLVFLYKFFRGFWRTTAAKRRELFTVLIGGGALWLLVMRNLAHYHEYVTLYLIGLLMVVWISLTDYLEGTGKPYLKIALSLFLVSVGANFALETFRAQEVNWQPGEFGKVRAVMEQNNLESFYLKEDYLVEFLDGVPFGENFYLSEFAATYTRSQADIVIERGAGDRTLNWTINK